MQSEFLSVMQCVSCFPDLLMTTLTSSCSLSREASVFLCCSALYDPTADLLSPRSHPQALSRGHFVGRAALILVGWDRRTLHKPPQLSEKGGVCHTLSLSACSHQASDHRPLGSTRKTSASLRLVHVACLQTTRQPTVVIGPLPCCCDTGRVIRSKLPILRWLGRI